MASTSRLEIALTTGIETESSARDEDENRNVSAMPKRIDGEGHSFGDTGVTRLYVGVVEIVGEFPVSTSYGSFDFDDDTDASAPLLRSHRFII